MVRDPMRAKSLQIQSVSRRRSEFKPMETQASFKCGLSAAMERKASFERA